MPTVRLYSQNGPAGEMSAATASSMKSPKSLVTLQTTTPVTIGSGSTRREEVLSFTFPFAPTDISIDGLAHEYAELQRPGRTPLVRFAKVKPLSISINVLVTHESAKGISSAEENVILLSTLARTKTDLIVTGLGPLISRAKYRITDMSVTVNRLSPDNKITMASVNLTLTQSVSVTQVVPGMIKIKDVPVVTTTTGKKTSSGGSSGDTSRWPQGDEAADFGKVVPIDTRR